MGARRAVLTAALAAAALAGCGGGDDENKSELPAVAKTIQFSTPAFKDGGAIPAANTCDGAGKPPTIVWRGLPPGSAELVLIVEDLDAKSTFTHWTVWRIAASTGAGLAPDGRFPAGFVEGKNSAGKTGWAPPCPPEGDDAHHYTFSLYALPKGTSLGAGAEPGAVRALLKDALGRGTFTGTYRRAS